MWESSTIVRRRRELWSGDKPTPDAAAASSPAPVVDEQADRRREERAHRYLHKLQTEFYSLPDNKLHEYIRFLQHDRLPEFAAKAKRLEAVAKHRDELLRVEEETCDTKFAYSLLQGLVCPASQAGSLHEQYIESIIAESRVKHSCRMVRTFVQRHPEIYQLERDWLSLFLEKSNQRLWHSQTSLLGRVRQGSSRSTSGLLILALIVMVPLVGYLQSESSGPSRRPTTREQKLQQADIDKIMRSLAESMEEQRKKDSKETQPQTPNASLSPAQRASGSLESPDLPVEPETSTPAEALANPFLTPEEAAAQANENPFQLVPEFDSETGSNP